MKKLLLFLWDYLLAILVCGTGIALIGGCAINIFRLGLGYTWSLSVHLWCYAIGFAVVTIKGFYDVYRGLKTGVDPNMQYAREFRTQEEFDLAFEQYKQMRTEWVKSLGNPLFLQIELEDDLKRWREENKSRCRFLPNEQNHSSDIPNNQ